MARTATVLHPTSVAETLALLAEAPDESKVIAGGTAFTILWRSGLIQASRLVSCAAVTEASYITIGLNGGPIRLGALTTFRAVETSVEVAQRLPVLTAALHHVANLRVRNIATWGGNVAEADNTSDLPALLVALDAEVVVRSVRGERVSRVGEFIVDFFETTLEPDELVVELRIPVPARTVHGSYVKLVSRSMEDRTCLGVAAFVDLDDDARCREIRVAAVGAAPTPLRLPEVETAVRDQPLAAATDELSAALVAAADPMSDIRGDAGYRRRVLPALVREALGRAAAGEDGSVLL